MASIVALAALSFTVSASGATHSLAGGEMRLRLNAGLQMQGIQVRPLRPAGLSGRAVTLPVRSGALDSDPRGGSVALAGGFKLFTARGTVTLRQLEFGLSTRRLRAVVGGKRIVLARLVGGSLRPAGFGARLTVERLVLTRAGAASLNRALGLRATLKPGRKLGSTDGHAKLKAVEIASGRIGIGGGAGFAKLQSIGAEIGGWGSAERWGNEPYFLFNLRPTIVAPDLSEGLLHGEGGVSFGIHAGPPRDLLLRDPTIDLATGTLSATVSSPSAQDPLLAAVATLDFGAARVAIRPAVGVFEVMRLPAIATEFIAGQLNARFQQPGLFQAGEAFATLTLVLRTF